jgi:hypothetical protein
VRGGEIDLNAGALGEYFVETLAAFTPYRTHRANRFGMFKLRDRPLGSIDYGVT